MARILLAEDDTATRDFMSRALASDGHHVVGVLDGLDALEHLEKESFDILITDVEMPGMDGVTLATRATASNPRLKILLVSGFTAGLDRASTILSANVKSLTKPVTLEQIRTEVKSMLA